MDVLNKVPVREQEPKVRATNFDEVCLGYNKDEAVEEASRCIGCKNAKCIEGCPVSINIPGFIAEVKEGKFEEACCKVIKVNPPHFGSLAMCYVRRRASVREHVYPWHQVSQFPLEN